MQITFLNRGVDTICPSKEYREKVMAVLKPGVKFTLKTKAQIPESGWAGAGRTLKDLEVRGCDGNQVWINHARFRDLHFTFLTFGSRNPVWCTLIVK